MISMERRKSIQNTNAIIQGYEKVSVVKAMKAV
jgi:hypothetical protein